ncbi:hypothetical protein V1509DRAFT_329034 [Lipomyces kononenkoae]
MRRHHYNPMQPHAPIVRKAAKALVDRNIPILEYGGDVDIVQLLVERDEIPWSVVGFLLASWSQLVEWALPDTLLSLSSQTLSERGVLCVPPSTKVDEKSRQWERAGYIHNLDRSVCPGYISNPCHLSALFSRTLSKSYRPLTTRHTLRVLMPKPRAYVLSLIRHLLNHSIRACSRL